MQRCLLMVVANSLDVIHNLLNEQAASAGRVVVLDQHN